MQLYYLSLCSANRPLLKKNVSELSQEYGEDHYGNDGKLSRYLLNLD